MRKNYLNDLKELTQEITKMSELVKSSIKNTVDALKKDDLIMAQEVINGDNTIDDCERSIENLCLKLLLTQQPVASDMRMVSSALKMITDLERIGDFSTDISEIVIKGGRTHTNYSIPFIEKMCEAVIDMVDGAVRSFAERDIQLAKRVCLADDKVDELFLSAKDLLVERIRKEESFAERALDLMMVSKYLERIGDHATNLAEWVIFYLTGVHINTEKGFLA